MKTNKSIIKLREIALFAMIGALMYLSKILLEFLPNIHLLGVFIVALTVVYRVKALIPIYVFVLITGYFNGFSVWWIPYLYIWAVLWGMTMLLPKNMPKKVRPFVYCAVSALHGLAYGTLYAPFQAVMFGLTFKQTLAWIAVGFVPWDLIHAAGNAATGVLIVPLITLLTKLKAAYEKN